MKKAIHKTWNIHRNTPMLESLFNQVAGPQDCCKTYLLHALFVDIVSHFISAINLLIYKEGL